MKITAIVIAFSLVSFVAPVYQAHAQPAELPKDLMVNGYPIDPFCFDQQEYSEKDGVDINKCRYEGIKIKGNSNPQVNSKGVVRFDYSFDEAEMNGPFVEYEFLGTTDKGQVVSVFSSGGGSGVFSSVKIVQRKEDKLFYVDFVAGGDRCNGGLVKVWVDNKEIYTESSLTPYDIAAIADSVAGKEPVIKSYDYLDACASCCAGTITEASGKIVSLKLNEEVYGESHVDSSESRHSCFGALYADKINKGQRVMNLDDAVNFSKEIQSQCK